MRWIDIQGLSIYDQDIQSLNVEYMQVKLMIIKVSFKMFILISTIKLGIDSGNNISVDNILFPYEFCYYMDL